MDRRCKQCGVIKEITEFHKDKNKKYGRRYTCKECVRKNKGQKKRNPENIGLSPRDKRLRNKYGITLEQYLDMCLACDSKCEICGKLVPQPYVDHDHITGKVRGLLCADCNTGIGFFKDNVDYLESAIKYLKKGYKDGSRKE